MGHDPENNTLLLRIAQGDESAVQEVIDEYGGLVWSIARRLTGSQSDAEEAAQEAFIEIWKSADRFDPAVAAERTFVSMLTRRRVIDYLRRRSRRPVTTEMAEGMHAAAPVASISDPMEVSEDVQRAEEALAALRPEQQDVLRLAVHRGLTHEQIAEFLGIPLGTVKTHARRGMIRLREMLSEATQTEGATS